MGEQVYYLDHAAATPCDPRVISAMEPYFHDIFCNPSAKYRGGREAREALDTARDEIAFLLGAKSHDIIFTAGATESLNIAIQGVLKNGGHVVFGATEHVAVRETASQFPHSEAAADRRGYITPEAVRTALRDDTVLVSIALADNEFGTVQPIKDIAQMLASVREERRKAGNQMPLYFHSDGSQGVTVLDLKVSRLGLDMLTLNAGKAYGPKQVGVLWTRPEVRLAPLYFGGGQERGVRVGTENVAGAVGCALALKLAQHERPSETKRLLEMRTKLVERLEAEVPDIVIDGHPKRHLPGHIHLHIDGLDAERVVYHLDNENIYIATGAACAANKAERLPSLMAVGLTESEADGSLRITLGHENSIEDIEFLAGKIAEAIRVERSL